MLFAVYDCETTGLPLHVEADLDRQPRIIEFGGIITDGESVLREVNFLCNPGVVLDQVITDITGLTDHDLYDKPPFIDYLPEVRDFFIEADCTVAHNASFDRNLLVFDLRRAGKTLKDISFPKLNICTVEETYLAYGRRMKLIELYSELCGEYVQKHRGLDDVMVLHEVCKRIGLYDAFKERLNENHS